MRLTKVRLLEMIPGLRIFLDVDDLTEGRGVESIDVSSSVLVFLSAGYLQRVNCMRELLRAAMTGKRLVTLVETRKDAAVAGVMEELTEADGKYRTRWGDATLLTEVEAWCGEPVLSVQGKALAAALVDGTPIAPALHEALFKDEAIKWHRLTAFQAVTLRLIAARLLPPCTLERPRMPRIRPCALACSHNNPGAAEFVQEASASLPVRAVDLAAVQATGQHDEAPLLLYLDARTWVGERSGFLQTEVAAALTSGMPVLLVHECDDARRAVAFDVLLNVTPQGLLAKGIYGQIAIALEGGAWREASLRLVGAALRRGGPSLAERWRGWRRRFSSARLVDDDGARDFEIEMWSPCEERVAI